MDVESVQGQSLYRGRFCVEVGFVWRFGLYECGVCIGMGLYGGGILKEAGSVWRWGLYGCGVCTGAESV